jgi:hypothetical protein
MGACRGYAPQVIGDQEFRHGLRRCIISYQTAAPNRFFGLKVQIDTRCGVARKTIFDVEEQGRVVRSVEIDANEDETIILATQILVAFDVPTARCGLGYEH